ncbi:MAG: hypothetical protein ABSG10_04280 [Terracidiphilus sp.]
MPVLNRRPGRIPRHAAPPEAGPGAAGGDGASLAVDVPGRAPRGLHAAIFTTCSNPRCGSGWLRLWRRRETPVFEGGWCCSEACMAERVASALSREMDGRGGAQEGYRHRIPLGLVMLEQGWITPQDLRAALAAQRAAGAGKLGGWLVRRKNVNEELVARALGLQWGCPVLSAEPHSSEGLAALVPRLFVDAFGALPLRMAAGKILYLGFEDHLDPLLSLAVERITGLRVEAGLVQESAFRPAHARMLEARFPAVELVEAATEPALAAALARAVERARPVEARLVRVHDCLWLRMWLRAQRGPLPEPAWIHDVIGSAGVH